MSSVGLCTASYEAWEEMHSYNEGFMLISCSLQALQEVFSKESLSCFIEKGKGEIAVDRLVIDMGVDARGRPQRIELAALMKLIPQQKKDAHINFLQIRYYFPFVCLPEKVSDVARYIARINQTLDFVGFGLSEFDRVIYYRHDLYCSHSKVDVKLLQGILGYILLCADSFADTFESLSTAQISL